MERVSAKDFQKKTYVMSDLWRVIWLRAIAKAWTDPEFKKRLLGNADKAFAELGYKVNHGLQIFVEEAPANTGWTETSGEYNKLPKTKLYLQLPPPPKETKFYAVAIADFAEAGRTYPFTCCC